MKISREQSGTYQKFGKQSAMVGSSWELGPASFVKQARSCRLLLTTCTTRSDNYFTAKMNRATRAVMPRTCMV